jgi:hypothetical protein
MEVGGLLTPGKGSGIHCTGDYAGLRARLDFET